MALCLSPTEEMEKESTTRPNWLELPKDLTANILKRLCVIEIVTSACLVCPLWWNICKDPLMWRTIHMTDLPSSHSELTKILLYAIGRSCGQVEDINIECFGQIKLLWCLYPSEGEVAKMHIGEVIGQSCPLLKSLKLGSTSDNDAFAISKTMSGLRHLKIFGGQISEAGLLAILEGCPHLETLHLQDCPNLDLSENLGKRCRDQIKDFTFLFNYQDQGNERDRDELEEVLESLIKIHFDQQY